MTTSTEFTSIPTPHPQYSATVPEAPKTQADSMPTEIFGQQKIDRIAGGKRNFVFNQTIVGNIDTEGSITVHSGEITQGKAQGRISATNSLLGYVTSESTADLTNSNFGRIEAAKNITAKNCHTGGTLLSNENITLEGCSKLCAEAKGTVSLNDCKNITSIKSAGSASVTNTQITSLEFTGSFTNSGAKITHLIVNPPGNNTIILNNPAHQPCPLTTLYLVDTEIEDITFLHREGRVVLGGKSKVTGTITNGKVL